MNGARLECVKCQAGFPLSQVNARCPTCDEPLEVRHDLNQIPRDWFKTRREGAYFQKYAPFYAYLQLDPALSLGEGQTALIRSHRLREKIGLKNLYFKNETQNPTWTFKDRGTALSLQNAVALGYQRFGAVSSGNGGASVAAYGARGGLKTFILLKDNVPREKIDALTVYGANALQVSGPYGDVYSKALELGREMGIYFSVSDEPMRVEGYKSLALEVFEQLGCKAPDYFAVPLGSGGMCRGILKGFEELRQAGFIAKVPVFIGSQSQGCSPMVDAWEKGTDRVERFNNPLTLDHVLENPQPGSGNQIIRKFRTYGGIIKKVSNPEVLEAQLLFAHEGILVQPASATALAGLKKAVKEGLVPPEAQVVTVISGSGLKYPPVLKEFGLKPIQTSVERLVEDLEALLK